ncbi:hypothetical protein EEDFHM_02804 [Methylorubrum populi]
MHCSIVMAGFVHTRQQLTNRIRTTNFKNF